MTDHEGFPLLLTDEALGMTDEALGMTDPEGISLFAIGREGFVPAEGYLPLLAERV
jgi:hypothetical protein